ncbi:hypothetical protein ACIQUQ_28190 [Streptomyces sp. NPDC101118]|uniref:hypothetical protein n=1 Tax=Streptomyces sp. NPDC101118 TaxID=3366109 RepID=UPI0038125242
MATSPKSHPRHGEGPSRHEGTEQHGWAQDVDSTHTQDNPSARRSFDTPEKTPGRESQSPPEPDEGVPVESMSTRGEEHARRGQQGHHDTGPRGRSQRPSGTKDESAYTGIGTGKNRKKSPGAS